MRARSSSLSSTLALVLCGALSAACSSDDSSGGSGGAGASGGTGASAGSGGGGAGGAGGSGGTSAGSGGGGSGGGPSGCTTTVEPGDDPTEAVQTALIEAKSGDTICLAAGTYAFTREISLASAQDITLRGAGERDEVILDFAGQTTGDDGITVTADGFTIENLWVKNTKGNGVVVKADDSTFRNIKVSWDAGSVTENGAYAIYPTNCNRTLIDGIEVTGAADAGVYVGQCTDAIVRNSKAYANVLGIEIENTINADVYDNEVYNNSGGILIDLLPNKEQKESHNALVRDNEVYQNNHANFAEPGGVIASVPPGTGIMVLAASDTEIRNNNLHDNDGVGIIVVSYEIIGALLGQQSDDPLTDQWPKRTYIHGNTFANNGTNPTGTYELIGVSPLENVIWDGFVDPEFAGPDGGAGDAAAMELCLGSPEKDSFRNFNAPGGLTPDVQSTDSTPHDCTLDPLPELSF